MKEAQSGKSYNKFSYWHTENVGGIYHSVRKRIKRLTVWKRSYHISFNTMAFSSILWNNTSSFNVTPRIQIVQNRDGLSILRNYDNYSFIKIYSSVSVAKRVKQIRQFINLLLYHW